MWNIFFLIIKYAILLLRNPKFNEKSIQTLKQKLLFRFYHKVGNKEILTFQKISQINFALKFITFFLTKRKEFIS